MTQIRVLILMGSDSDAPIMQAASDILRELGIPCEMTVASAHRSPERVTRLVREAPGRGVKVFIVGAGAAAHLAGVVAAHTTMPVIGVPIDSSALKGSPLARTIATTANVAFDKAKPNILAHETVKAILKKLP